MGRHKKTLSATFAAIFVHIGNSSSLNNSFIATIISSILLLFIPPAIKCIVAVNVKPVLTEDEVVYLRSVAKVKISYYNGPMQEAQPLLSLTKINEREIVFVISDGDNDFATAIRSMQFTFVCIFIKKKNITMNLNNVLKDFLWVSTSLVVVTVDYECPQNIWYELSENYVQVIAAQSVILIKELCRKSNIVQVNFVTWRSGATIGLTIAQFFQTNTNVFIRIFMGKYFSYT